MIKNNLYDKNNVYELASYYNARKSFYGKALVEIKGRELILYSYLKKVCYIKDNEIHLISLDSNTTNRHIREFLRQNEWRFSGNEKYKKLIDSDYSKKELENIMED